MNVLQCFLQAPEALQDPKQEPTREGDVYSFAIIMIEIFTCVDPYNELSDIMEPMEIIAKVLCLLFYFKGWLTVYKNV